MNQKTILIVDDDSGIRQFLTFVLQAKGYAVDTASDGVEGLHKALEGHPDLVITDVQMPHMDGIDMVKAIHADWPAQSVVVMTAFATEGKMDYVKASGIPLLEKPFTVDALFPLVERMFYGS